MTQATNTIVNNTNKGGKTTAKHLSLGNAKLPKTIAIFNLPRLVTCPGATAWCKQYCYTEKSERAYPNVKPFRYRNWDLAKSPEFVDTIVAEIKKLKVKTVRVHESGDFYNQEYLDKWIAIANQMPEVTFFAYTKSYHLLDFSKLPDNFIVRASMDSTTPLTLRKKYSKLIIADIKDHGASLPKGFFECPGSCKKCTYCYTKGNGNVCFNKH